MKKIYIILIITISLLSLGTISVFATNSISSQTAKESTPVVDVNLKIYDYANLLTESEETSLYSQIQEFINTYEMDMAGVTIEENNK